VSSASLGIVLVEGDGAAADFLAQALESQGHRVLGVADNAAAALDMLQRLNPELAVLGRHLPDTTAPALAQRLYRQRPLPVVLISGDEQAPPELDPASQVIHCWLPWPVDPFTLAAGVLAVNQSFARIQALQGEIDDLKQVLHTRKLTERAKGLLMEAQGLSRDQAQTILQQRADAKGVSLAEAAGQVIESLGNAEDGGRREIRRGGKGSRPG